LFLNRTERYTTESNIQIIQSYPGYWVYSCHKMSLNTFNGLLISVKNV